MLEALGPKMAAIQEKETDNEKMAALARETYKVVKQVLEDIIPEKHTWRTKGNLVLLGGIMINVDGANNDMFAP